MELGTAVKSRWNVKFSTEVEGFETELEKLAQLTQKAAVERILMAGAKVVRAEIVRRLDALPTEKDRRLNVESGERFQGVPARTKTELRNDLGISPMQSENGSSNVKLGWDGYTDRKTKKYPAGVPLQLLARSIESGSSVRQKTPFVGLAVRSSKNKALEKMREQTEAEMAALGIEKSGG